MDIKSARSVEVIIYYENCDKISKIIDVILTKPNVKDYAVVLHNKDDKKAHYHVELFFFNPQPLTAVIGWFKDFSVTSANLAKIGSKKGVLAYLTHANHPEKYQYDLTEVVHSNGIEEELKQSTQSAKRKVVIKSLCDSVALGTLSPRALYAKLSGVEIRDNAHLIQGSIDASLTKAQAQEERNMKVFYITGAPGSGKSTLARYFASELTPEPPYISSSSNDPLQDYLLESAIILDDLRGDAFKFADLLKLTDNFVPSSVKCRFKNKTINAKYLFITSTRKPNELYSAKSFSKDDNLDQFLRRIKACYTIAPNGDITQTVYEPRNGSYEPIRQLAPVGNMAKIFQKMAIDKKSDTLLDKMTTFLQV